MSQLSDIDILEAFHLRRVVIEPFIPELLQPASVDLTLSNSFAKPQELLTRYSWITLDEGTPPYESLRTDCITIRPGEFLLGSTEQTVTLGSDIAARFEGKSSIGRRGLMAHITAGFIDPGFSGQITLELYNAGPWPIALFKGNRIGQLVFYNLENQASAGYGDKKWGSHYQGQTGATGARS